MIVEKTMHVRENEVWASALHRDYIMKTFNRATSEHANQCPPSKRHIIQEQPSTSAPGNRPPRLPAQSLRTKMGRPSPPGSPSAPINRPPSGSLSPPPASRVHHPRKSI